VNKPENDDASLLDMTAVRISGSGVRAIWCAEDARSAA